MLVESYNNSKAESRGTLPILTKVVRSHVKKPKYQYK